MKRIPKLPLLLGFMAMGTGMIGNLALAQTKKAAAKAKTPGSSSVTNAVKDKKTKDGFTRLESGLEYRIYAHGNGTRKPQVNDHVELNIIFHVEDSVIFSSRKMNNNRPVPLAITNPKFKGDPMEGFMQLAAGDSAVIRLSCDSMKKQVGQQPWMKEGKMVEYNVVMMSVRTEAEEKKYQEEQAARQKSIDDKEMQAYFEKNHIKAMKTASGLYYSISNPGSGESIRDGQKATVNYTGKLLNGKTFDSNTDSNFHHVQPFSVEVGKAHVIKGWDEGLKLLKKGSKAVLYIPSGLAYGSQDRSPQIPANSVLVFDIEITDVETPVDQSVADDKLLQEYFSKNNIKAEKTKSGLYYSISEKGLGANAAAGKKVTMNYTGKTLDGKVFDSNTDPKFNHVQPFSFTLGVGQVIKGWDEGVQLLKLGSKAVFYIPSGLAYGERGAGGSIPPNSVLIFDVEVTGIDK